MSVHDVPLRALDGNPTSLEAFAGKAILAVNVASRCGLTPRCSGLERLQERYARRGFTVIGFACAGFAGQESGTAEDIATFCATTSRPPPRVGSGRRDVGYAVTLSDATRWAVRSCGSTRSGDRCGAKRYG
jgi:hypothetical protein